MNLYTYQILYEFDKTNSLIWESTVCTSIVRTIIIYMSRAIAVGGGRGEGTKYGENRAILPQNL